MENYRIVGLMSGTSLDGIDVAACEFFYSKGTWTFRIHHAETYRYSEEWIDKLTNLPATDAMTYARVNVEYGHLLGETVRIFLTATGFQADLIASHGHTIFHQPAAGFTAQIGSGSAIATETGLPVACDFRSADVSMGGQGAPLVPVGDRLLFGDYDACLNLGGFSNISMETGQERIAFDICPVNIILNKLAGNLGKNYDLDGKIAASGKIDEDLLNKLNNLSYYNAPPPKSLGREWLERVFLPALDDSEITVADKLRTVCEHVAIQVNRVFNSKKGKKILVTGGGAWNTFLMDRIRDAGYQEFIIPEPSWVDYKEALVFALLGVLRMRGEVNVLRSVTGSLKDHSGGAVYQPTLLPPPPGDASP